jgi:hypothetical protein
MFAGSSGALTMLYARDVSHRAVCLHYPPPNHYWHSLCTQLTRQRVPLNTPLHPSIFVLLHASNSRDAGRLSTTVGTTVPAVPGRILYMTNVTIRG